METLPNNHCHSPSPSLHRLWDYFQTEPNSFPLFRHWAHQGRSWRSRTSHHCSTRTPHPGLHLKRLSSIWHLDCLQIIINIRESNEEIVLKLHCVTFELNSVSKECVTWYLFVWCCFFYVLWHKNEVLIFTKQKCIQQKSRLEK